MRLLPKFSSRSPVTAHFAPADRFFMRFVPLAPDLPVPGQVELALEGLAPFPSTQLYWGCCVAPGRTAALVYAAHRRRFPAEETAAWASADVVLPDIVSLFGAAPTGVGLKVLAGETRLGGAAWDGKSRWPVAVHARDYDVPVTEDHRRQFAAELAAKAGLDAAPPAFLHGGARARQDGADLIFELLDPAGAPVVRTVFPVADQDLLDIRDRAFLAQRRRDRRRGDFVWKLMLAGAWGAAAAVALDLGALGLRLADRALQSRLAAQKPFVEKLEAGHSLASRIDELTHRRLRFFEMLAMVNESRPASVQFNRTGTSGRNGLEIEAQTGSPGDVGAYEAALRRLAALERVEVRDLRARDGVTTFGLTVAFKPDAMAGNGGAP